VVIRPVVIVGHAIRVAEQFQVVAGQQLGLGGLGVGEPLAAFPGDQWEVSESWPCGRRSALSCANESETPAGC
jgi:hypothetical protein